jgi:hypothetical protein
MLDVKQMKKVTPIVQTCVIMVAKCNQSSIMTSTQNTTMLFTLIIPTANRAKGQ